MYPLILDNPTDRVPLESPPRLTRYPVMGLLPLLAGSFHTKVAVSEPPLTTATLVGALGGSPFGRPENLKVENI
jgi:hypothetical protein